MGFWNIKGLRKEHLDATRTDTSLFSLEGLKILPFFRELKQKEQIHTVWHERPSNYDGIGK